MATIADYQFVEVPAGGGSTPFTILPGSEVLLTSFFLNIVSSSAIIDLNAVVGWGAQQLLLNELPSLTFRIRRGGIAAPATIVFQTIDSAFLGTASQGPFPFLTFTTTFEHTEVAPANTVGTFQQYALTVEFTGVGNATISGPVHFSGKVLA